MGANIWSPGGTIPVTANADNTIRTQSFIATAGQTSFTLNTFVYQVGTGSLSVYVNGTKQRLGVDFSETSNTSFTFTSGVELNDIVEAIGLVGGTGASGAAISAAAALTSQQLAQAAYTSIVNLSLPNLPLPVSLGGTNSTTALDARAALGIPETTPISKGGTGATTAADARTALSVVSTSDVINVAHGGTGVTTITGVIKGNGTSNMSAAVAGTDFVAPGSILTSGLTQNTAKLIGRTTASSGAPEEITVVSPLSLSSGNLSVAQRGLVFLTSASASSSANVDVEHAFDSTYDTYILIISGLTVQTNSTTLQCRMKLAGSYDTGTNYDYHTRISNSASSSYSAVNGNTQSSITMSETLLSASSGQFEATITIKKPFSTAFSKSIRWEGSRFSAAANMVECSGVGGNVNTGALTGLRFFAASGNIVAGDFALYGLVKA